MDANQGYSASYEQDDYSKKLKTLLLDRFNAVDAAMVFNGTAANVIALQIALKSYESVLCTDVSHLHLDECGAPEKIAGVKLIPCPSHHGKFVFEELENFIIRRGDQHHSQVRMVSITQPTEYGTLYSLDEIRAIRELCDRNQLYLHIDGARYANALVSGNWSFQEIANFSDVLSFGGAKNGLMLGEFVIVRNSQLKQGLKFYRKQSLQLPAKTRFLSAPYIKYLESNLWKSIAEHENQMAQKLREGLERVDGIEFTQPTQANSVFCIFPKELHKRLRKQFFFYVWDEKTRECRLMTSFATKSDEVEQFIQLAKQGS